MIIFNKRKITLLINIIFIFVFITILIPAKPVFADSREEFQTCLDDCTSDYADLSGDAYNTQFDVCKKMCTASFPVGAQIMEDILNRSTVDMELINDSDGNSGGGSGITFTPSIPVGEFKGAIPVNEEILGKYLDAWYKFVVGAAGILAAVIIMWGGFKWLTSRGNSAAISDAKDRIWSAIIGLILVFLSYILLSLINSNLVNPILQPLKVSKINIEALRQSEPQGRDMVTGETDINNNQQTQNLETFTGSGINVQTPQVRLDGLTPEILDVTQQIRNDFGQDITVTSGYRPHSTGSQHADGRAVDLARSPEFNNFMNTEVIGNAQPAWYYHGQPAYEVNYNGVNIRVIDEVDNNVWHIDTKPR